MDDRDKIPFHADFIEPKPLAEGWQDVVQSAIQPKKRGRMMKILKLLQLSVEKVYWDRACAHKPMDPDMPRIIMQRQRVRDELKKLLA